jgi:hypothetical protein
VGGNQLADAVILNSVTSHKALLYGTASLRLSLDVHYQLTSEALGPDSLLPENPRHLTWPEIHRHWPGPDPSSTLGAGLT